MGEKLVTIALETDSPKTPVVPLQLRLIGSRSPPFLLRAVGNLNYLEDIARSEPREITVLTVEKGAVGRAPKVISDLSFLKIELVSVKDDPYPDPGAVGRTYTYRVSVGSGVPQGTISGFVSITSPWDPSHVLSILVHAPNFQKVRVSPSRLVIDANDPALRAEGPGAQFFLVVNDPAEKRQIEVEQPKGSPLIVERQSVSETNRFVAFSVHLKPDGVIHGGEYPLSIRLSQSSEPTVVPVTVHALEASAHVPN